MYDTQSDAGDISDRSAVSAEIAERRQNTSIEIRTKTKDFPRIEEQVAKERRYVPVVAACQVSTEFRR